MAGIIGGSVRRKPLVPTKPLLSPPGSAQLAPDALVQPIKPSGEPPLPTLVTPGGGDPATMKQQGAAPRSVNSPLPTPGGGDLVGDAAPPVYPDGFTPPASPAAPTPSPVGVDKASQLPSGIINTSQAAAAPASPVSPPSPTVPATGTTSSGPTAWTPTGGVADQVGGITPENVVSQGYATGATPDTKGYTAEGYKPETYTAEKATENLSGAVDRIIGQDSELMQREQARAAIAANSRGLLNSTMAVQAGRAAVLDKATELGQGDINVGMFNAQQANDAAKFSSQASNDAAGFLANAKNMAAQFTSGESNKMAMFAVEQANLAARFSAEAENAARTFNAEAYNTAMQRYTDAKNAALAAQNDAINLSRRDTAQIKASAAENNARIEGQIKSAGISASAQIQSAQIASETSKSNLAAQLAQQGLQLQQQEQQFVSTMNQTQFNGYQNGLLALNLNEMEPDARQNALHNYNSVWAATNYLPFTINMSAFPPATPPAP